MMQNSHMAQGDGQEHSNQPLFPNQAQPSTQNQLDALQEKARQKKMQINYQQEVMQRDANQPPHQPQPSSSDGHQQAE